MEGSESQTKARKFHRSTRRPEEPWCTSFEIPFDRLARPFDPVFVCLCLHIHIVYETDDAAYLDER